MATMDELFDGSNAHELCNTCGGTGRILDGEECTFCDVFSSELDKPDRDTIKADCAELLDIAKWFDDRGHKMQGDFLRGISKRHECCSLMRTDA